MVILIFSSAAVFAAVGCAPVGATSEVRVVLPDTPGHWRDAWGVPAFAVRWQSHPSSHGETYAGVGTPEIVLRLPKGVVVALAAWPVWPAGGPALATGERMRPAGGIWDGRQAARTGGALTLGRPPEEVALTWADGPLAAVLMEAATRGADIQSLNHPRLASEARERVDGDPWKLDRARLLEAICDRAMRSAYIRELPLNSVMVEIPEGTWLGSSPFGEPVPSGVRELLLPEGVSAFYHEYSRRLVICVDAEGRSWAAISPPD